MCPTVTRDVVLAQRDALPAFPLVIEKILETIDDPDANINLLVSHVSHDPVLSARVYALANTAASNTRRDAKIRDLYTATSLVGLTRLREAVIMTSLAGFLRGAMPSALTPGFWQHSAATGISAQQVAAYAHLPGDPALIAGLLHDIGQLWLYRFDPESFMAVWKRVAEHELGIVEAERDIFGVDHAQVGAWLSESWGLPPPICAAILHHHVPDSAVNEPLVAVIHVAEVLSNALDLSGGNPRVTYLSSAACDKLGLRWDDSVEPMFGRIEGAGRYVASYFKGPGDSP